MISNQVMLASIWYLCSCSSITSAAFKQTRASIRNFIWGARVGQTTRAKISWKVVIQPTIHGGVKIIDPTLQAAALLTKIIVRGLKPSYEPWKTFIRHEVQLTKMTDQKRCPPSPHWIMHATRARTAASSLWKTLFQAFTQTRQGLEQRKPIHHKDILRQQLFGNPLFLDTEGNMFGVEKDSAFTIWATHDTCTLQDIWDVETQD